MMNNKKIMCLVLVGILGMLATGCSDSSPVAVTPPDTAPPASPANVRSQFDHASGAAVITWSENTVDADLAGYVVTRENNCCVEDLISAPTMVHSVQDDDPPMGVSVYSVYAVDQAGNESPVMQATLTRALGHGTGDRGH